MKFSAIIRLLLTFYKSFLLFSILITLACTTLYWEYGSHILKVLLCFKIATLALTKHFIRDYKKREFYYYRNLGIRDTVLWSVTLSCDLALWLVLLTITHQLHP